MHYTLKNVSNAIVSQGLPKMSFGEEFSLREKEYLQKLLEGGKKTSTFNRSMEVKLVTLLGNYDRPTIKHSFEVTAMAYLEKAMIS